MPPLKPWQIMPVPPPTEPSCGSAALALSSAANTCSGFTCMPLMSFSDPSYVSATTGSHHGCKRVFLPVFPLDDGIAHDANAVRIRDRDWPLEHAALLDPRRAGHFAVAVEREPGSEHGIRI